MHPVSNQPAPLFATAKTHKFKSLEEINVDQLKLHPIIDQTGTYLYNTSKVIAKYLKPLETINYIVDRIYVRKEIEPLCKKSIFKKLLFKLTKGCVFSVTGKLLKQVDGCPMGGPISAVFSDIFMCKMEFDVVVPAKPIFYKSYVDDTYVQRKKNDVDKLLEELNSYNENIKLTLKVNPTQFLDTELVREN